MKTYTILLAATLIASSVLARAQGEATLEPLQIPDLFTPIPSEGTPTAAPATAPATVAPAETAPSPTPSAALKNGTAEQIRQAIRIRELKTVVQENAEVQAWKEKAACTKTEEGRRVAMRNYYTLLYTKMEKLEPSLFPVLEGQLHDILASYEQHNIRPSLLIEPITPLPGSRSEDHAALADQQDPAREKQIKINSLRR